MKLTTFNKLKIMTITFVEVTAVLAILQGNIIWGLITIAIGIIFLKVIKSKTKDVVVDERIINIGQKAGQLSFNVITLSLGISSIFLVVAPLNKFGFPQTLGIILSYITIFSLLIYVISYHYFLHSNEDEK